MTQQDLGQIKNVFNQEIKKALEENNKNLVTKDDLYENNKRLAKVFATKQDIKDLVTKNEYHKTVDQILTALDNIYGIVKNVETHVFAN